VNFPLTSQKLGLEPEYQAAANGLLEMIAGLQLSGQYNRMARQRCLGLAGDGYDQTDE
jgi:hypothetical protein